MKAAEIRNLSAEELDKKLAELKDELFKLRFQQAVNQLVIESDARFVHLAGSLRQNPRPGNREAVIPDAVGRHQGHVFPETVIVVTGDPAVGVIADCVGLLAELVPVARAFPILIPCAFYLKRGCCGAPDKILRKTHSNSLLFLTNLDYCTVQTLLFQETGSHSFAFFVFIYIFAFLFHFCAKKHPPEVPAGV